MTRINTNVPALVAMGRFRTNSNDLNVRLERLATGLRINRGSDDPAGLIASETLRQEIRGISQAISNSQRAINVISVAEGALAEVSTLLMDIKALVLGIANEGAMTDEEIQANQTEIDAILSSIDRIANTTTFAGKKLLNGQMGYTLSGLDTGAIAHTETYAVRIPDTGNQRVTVVVQASAQLAALSFTGATTSAASIELAGRKGTEVLSFQSGTTAADIQAAINNIKDITGVSAVITGGSLVLNSTEFGSDAYVSVKALSGRFMGATEAGTSDLDYGVDPDVIVNGHLAHSNGLRVDSRSPGYEARFYLTAEFAQTLSQTQFDVTGGGALFQVTPLVTAQGQVNVGLDSLSTAHLGNSVVGFLSSIRSGGENEVARRNFAAAEALVSEAITQVSKLRGRLGSVQKERIETVIRSQQVALENVTASESAIRDADYAVEVSAMTRAQILIQATSLTLNVAQQVPQTALQLLGG